MSVDVPMSGEDWLGDVLAGNGASGRERVAFERVRLLYLRHREKLIWTAKCALFEYARAHALDLVSEVIIDAGAGAFPELPNAEPRAVAFLKSVIRHRASHINRREARVVALSGEEPSGEMPDPWRRAGQVLIARDVANALDRLTPREREVAVLHWLDGWSSVQIGEALGISARTVKELLRRGRRGLRARLALYDGGPCIGPSD